MQVVQMWREPDQLFHGIGTQETSLKSFGYKEKKTLVKVSTKKSLSCNQT